MMGRIARIQRFSTTNGPGLRSTVFMKGCPLRCLWCHNPEMQSFGTELMVYAKTCTVCGGCANVCSQNVHSFADGIHFLSRKDCILCGKCAERCPNGAIEIVGEEISAAEVVKRLLRDRIFFSSGKGGITLSGGEPLAQFDFTQEILRQCKSEGLHTCLDTSGWGGRAQEIVEFTDLFLWDIKETDPVNHRRVTGTELEPILQSLCAVDARGAEIILRCPIIPGVNDRESYVREIGAIASELHGVKRIDLVPYHRFGVPKAEAIGMNQKEFDRLDAEMKDTFLQTIREKTTIPVQWI